jgi:hypothetical protein
MLQVLPQGVYATPLYVLVSRLRLYKLILTTFSSSFIGQLWPQDVKPSLTHEFIKYLETEGKVSASQRRYIDSN